MEQSAARPSITGAPIYVAASALVSPSCPLPLALAIAAEAGADGFELGQELIPPLINPDDLEDLPSILARFPARPALAVAQPLFVTGKLQRDLLLATLVQCRALGCALVSFPLGDISQLSSETLDALHRVLTSAHERAPAVRITVTNDPTPAGASVDRWRWLLEHTSQWDVATLMTFDLGNWACAGVDGVTAAQALGRYVAYIHVKRTSMASGVCVTLPIQPAERIHPALEYLPADAPRALTGAIAATDAASDRDQLVVRLSELVEALRAGTFTT